MAIVKQYADPREKGDNSRVLEDNLMSKQRYLRCFSRADSHRMNRA